MQNRGPLVQPHRMLNPLGFVGPGPAGGKQFLHFSKRASERWPFSGVGLHEQGEQFPLWSQPACDQLLVGFINGASAGLFVNGINKLRWAILENVGLNHLGFELVVLQLRLKALDG